jgi:hypothetical protein
MTAEAKREAIEKLYGNIRFHGKELSSMQERQIHAIYGRLMNSGAFVELDDLKHLYIKQRNHHPNAIKKANQMSIFELRKAVAEVNQKDKPGYQYTLFDWRQELEGKEQEKEWKKNLK